MAAIAVSMLARKGGVGKTSTALNLAGAALDDGAKSVLLIDMEKMVRNVNRCRRADLRTGVHISQSKVSRAIAALTVPVEVQQAVESGKVGATTAVKQARRKPSAAAGRGRRPARTKAVRIPGRR